MAHSKHWLIDWQNIAAMFFALKGKMGGFFGGCGISKLVISQFCAKTGEEKVIKNTLTLVLQNSGAGGGFWVAEKPPGRRPVLAVGRAFETCINCPQKWKKQGVKTLVFSWLYALNRIDLQTLQQLHFALQNRPPKGHFLNEGATYHGWEYSTAGNAGQ